MSTYQQTKLIADTLTDPTTTINVSDTTVQATLATMSARLDAPMDTFIGVRNGDIPAWAGSGFSTGDTTCTQLERQLVNGMPVGGGLQTHLGFSADRVGRLLDLASSSVNDTSAGTGVQVVGLAGIYLSAPGVFSRTFRVYTMNGQTQVEMDDLLWHNIEFMISGNVGSGGFNDGQISIGERSDTWTAGVPDTLWGVYPANTNISRMINLGCASNENCFPGIWTLNTDTNANNAGVEFTFLIRGWSTFFGARTQRAFKALVIGNLTKSTYGVGFGLDPGDVFQPSVVASTGTHQVGFFIDVYRKDTS